MNTNYKMYSVGTGRGLFSTSHRYNEYPQNLIPAKQAAVFFTIHTLQNGNHPFKMKGFFIYPPSSKKK